MLLFCQASISERIFTLQLSDCQRTPRLKQARYLKLISLAKWFSVCLQWLWIRIQLLSHRGNSWIYNYWSLLLENLKVCFVSL